MLTRKNTNETHVETSLIDRFRYQNMGPDSYGTPLHSKYDNSAGQSLLDTA